MDSELRKDLKKRLQESIYNYVLKFKYETIHPLDLLIPRERKVRSVVGGLETSMGTTVWEPVAKTLAERNNFEVIQEKILKPNPMPPELSRILSDLISKRESRDTWVNVEQCKIQLRDVCRKINRDKINYIAPPAGTGVDILIKKDNKYYAYDAKTVQPNLGGMKSFNKQLLEWYAYSICKNPDIDISCMIAYPYNPYAGDFWNRSPHNKEVLEPHVDAVLENEFWDFISGFKNTYQTITDILIELDDEGFGEELSRLIEKVNNIK